MLLVTIEIVAVLLFSTPAAQQKKKVFVIHRVMSCSWGNVSWWLVLSLSRLKEGAQRESLGWQQLCWLPVVLFGFHLVLFLFSCPMVRAREHGGRHRHPCLSDGPADGCIVRRLLVLGHYKRTDRRARLNFSSVLPSLSIEKGGDVIRRVVDSREQRAEREDEKRSDSDDCLAVVFSVPRLSLSFWLWREEIDRA